MARVIAANFVIFDTLILTMVLFIEVENELLQSTENIIKKILEFFITFFLLFDFGDNLLNLLLSLLLKV